MELTPNEAKIKKERAARYGDATKQFEHLGHVWYGILKQYYGDKFDKPIPNHIVLLMHAAGKIQRAAIERNAGDDDSYVDAKIYIELARTAKKGLSCNEDNCPDE